MSRALFSMAAITLVLTSCGPDTPERRRPSTDAEGPTATVEFIYKAPTARDASIADCGAGETHIHPSWRKYEAVYLDANGANEWRTTFTDVPVSAALNIRVNDPNKCNVDSNGATTEGIYANGVLLTRVVDTPGNGIEPGLRFALDAAGNVTP